MGKDYGPTWATLAVGYLEETKLYPQIRRQYPTEIADKFEKDYQRFQDDTLLINEHGVSKDLILELFNNLHPQLEFTSENSETELPFLDGLITIQDTTIETQIYHKKTDSFNYLHFGSNHPWHTKRNIPYSLARRIRGIVSNKGHRIQSYLELRKRLITKKYPRPLIDDALKKAESTPRLTIINSGASKNAKEQTNITTLVTTHHPVLDKIGAEIITISARAGLDCLKGTYTATTTYLKENQSNSKTASSTATDVADFTLIDNPEIIESTTKKRGTSAKKTIKAKRTKKEVISKDVVAGDVI
ncbi:hypothetical protein ACHWQZ_G013481 [Mnemiopsis leidyi]